MQIPNTLEPALLNTVLMASTLQPDIFMMRGPASHYIFSTCLNILPRQCYTVSWPGSDSIGASTVEF